MLLNTFNKWIIRLVGISMIAGLILFDSADTTELKLIKEFPSSNDEIYIGKPVNMAFDHKSNVFISDRTGSNILKFDKDGNFIKQIGRQGKGPGEFSNIGEIRVNDSLLAAYNQSQIQIYDSDGTFKDMFRIFGLRNYWLTGNKFYTNKHDRNLRDLMQEDKTEAKLIQIFNMEGEKIDEFGSLLDIMPYKNSMQKIMSNSLLIREYRDKLYILFRYFPVLRVYDLESLDLVKEITFDDPFDYANTRISENYSSSAYSEQGVMRLRFLFNAFDVSEEGIFLGLYDDNILIDHYNPEGQFIERYRKKYNDSPYYLHDIKVLESDSESLNLYSLSRKDGVPLVEIFAI